MKCIEVRLNAKENLCSDNITLKEPAAQIFKSTAEVYMPSSVNLLGKKHSQTLYFHISKSTGDSQ